MSDAEKLDLILKELYQYRLDGHYHSLTKATKNPAIKYLDPDDLKLQAHNLLKDNMISLFDLGNELLGKITPGGVVFCKTTSYAYKGHPIITKAER